MADLNNRLNNADSASVANIISGLIQVVKEKQKPKEREIPELIFLKEKCVDLNNWVSRVACKGILRLVEDGILEARTLLADYSTIITTTKCSPEIAYLMNNLLLANMNKQLSEDGDYKCEFNLRVPQHPFIIMLNEIQDCWPRLFTEMVWAYRNDRNGHYCNELYKPVYLYVLCDPGALNLAPLKLKLWNFLVQNEDSQSYDTLKLTLQWMQIQNPSMAETNSEFLNELSEFNLESNNLHQGILLLWQASFLHYLIANNLDPRETIPSMAMVISSVQDTIFFESILLMLSRSISVCSCIYLADLLELCKLIMEKHTPRAVILYTIKSSLLHWIASSSILTTEITHIAQELLIFIQQKLPHSKKPKDQKLSTMANEIIDDNLDLILINNEVYHCLKLNLMMDRPDWHKNFVRKLKDAPDCFLYRWVNLLFGLFLSEDSEVAIDLLHLINRCAKYNKKINSQVLTLFLHKLSNTTDQDLHFHILKSLPKTAVIPENFVNVLSFLQALGKGPGCLQTFSLPLWLDLWKVDNKKCYPYLENALTSPYSTTKPSSDSTLSYKELSISNAYHIAAKVYILKELCALRPELYGKEIVAHLSKILNECNDENGGALACALAIEGITSLCLAEVIDAVTTWANLAPKFKNDKRVSVIKSLCQFISEIPHLPYTDAYPQLTQEVLETLWSYITNTADLEILLAAFDSLSNFSVDQIVGRMPEKYSEKNDVNVKKVADSTLEIHWINLLRNCTPSTIPLAEDFLKKLISREVDGFLKSVYQVKRGREPNDYSYLPGRSVVRVITWYLKSMVLKVQENPNDATYLSCLKILSKEYSRPLPPLDWCFLQELIHEPKFKHLCIDIASHQVIISGTARRLIENYILALTENHNREVDDVLSIYKNLRHLANSIQPVILKPFLEVTLLEAVAQFDAGDKLFLTQIEGFFRETLRNADVQEANKFSIAQIISGVVNNIESSSELLTVLLDSIIHFPSKQIEELTSRKRAKELTKDWFEKSVMIRTHLAKNSDKNPLEPLKEIIECGSSFEKLTPFVLRHFASVFVCHKDNTECVLWLLDFIGEMQALAADKADKKEIFYRCDVFMLATLVFSGHFVYLEEENNDEFVSEEMLKMFPQAMADLLDVNHWSICTTQALEWFHQMTSAVTVSENYRKIFSQCLQALRHDSEFKKNIKWMKYLNIHC